MKKAFLFCSIMFILGTFISIMQKMETYATICYIIIAFVFFILYLCAPKPKPKEKTFKDFHITLSHLIGLSFPEDVDVLITYTENTFTFSANNIEFSLPLERIKDLSIKTSQEIQQQYISSVGGAAAGAFLFGPLGAMIGGRAKKKNVKKILKCLIITYLKDNEMKYIAFNLDSYDEINAKELIKKFKKENTNVEIAKFEL